MLTFGFVVPLFSPPEIDYDIVSTRFPSKWNVPNMKETPLKSLSYVTMEGYLLVSDFEHDFYPGEKVFKLNDDLANS